MDFTLHVWRQKDSSKPGKLETYQAKNISLMTATAWKVFVALAQ